MKLTQSRSLISGLALILALMLAGATAFAGELADIQDAIKAKKARWVAGETTVSALPEAERQKRVRLKKPEITGDEPYLQTAPPPDGLAPSLDWRSNNGLSYVTPVRNQGSCGSCWAFATTAALESNVLIRNSLPGFDENLAEQILVSCSGAGSCSGGYIDRASSYLRDTGLPAEAAYPYTGTNGSCANAASGWQAGDFHIDSWAYVATTAPTLDNLKNALATYGPLVTTMDVYADFFSYKSGIYSYTSGAHQGGHAILLVGYDDASQCFIAKNSWGTGWGESGFFRIAYTELKTAVQFGHWTISYYTQATDPPAPPPPPPDTCTYTLSPLSQSFPGSGGSGSVGITAGGTCTWTATSSASWITVTQVSASSGAGAVQYTVAPNNSKRSRQGAISVAGQQFVVNQDKRTRVAKHSREDL